jgi:hypothetical protein
VRDCNGIGECTFVGGKLFSLAAVKSIFFVGTSKPLSSLGEVSSKTTENL